MAHYKAHEAQDWAWQTLKGQWSTLITPFTDEGDLDEDGLRRNVRHVRRPGHTRRGLHLGHGRVLEPHPRRARPRDGHRRGGSGGQVARRRARHPHVEPGDRGPRQARRARRLRPARRRRPLHGGQDGGPGRRVRPHPQRQHQPCRHVLQLAAVRHRHEPPRPEAHLRAAAGRRRQGSQLQPAALHRDPPLARQGLRHQHPRRVDLPLRAGPRIPAAGDVREHLRLALRHPRMQLLRAVHREGERRRL